MVIDETKPIISKFLNIIKSNKNCMDRHHISYCCNNRISKTSLKLDSKFNLLFRAYPSEVDVGRSHDPFLVGVQIPGVGRQGEALDVRRQVQGEGN